MSDASFDPFGLVGQVLDGQYRVDAVVGEGGYGVVYRGWHIAFEQPVAIKALKMPDVTDAETRISVLTKFREEAKLSYVLSQATLSIVRCIGYNAVVTPSQAWAPYLVLEWLEGRPLSEDLESRRRQGLGGRTLVEALDLLAPAAAGLVYAHSQRVAHRDIKPANVFLLKGENGGRPLVKLLDFGIAKVMEADTTAANAPRTKGGLAAFTPYYAAPEQIDPRLGATGPWTDVYAFALILVEVLSGNVAMRGSDVVSIIANATDPQRRPTPRAQGVTVTDAVENVFARALVVDPKGRYPDLGVFWESLTAAAAHGSHGSLRPPEDPHRGGHPPAWASPTHTVPMPVAETVSSPVFHGAGGTARMSAPVPSTPPASSRRRPWKLILGVAILLILSMVVGAIVASEYAR